MRPQTYKLYECRAKFEEAFGPKASWEGPGMYNTRTGYMMDKPQGDVICAPQIQRLMPDYYSVVSDTWITDRYDRREDLKRTNCFELDREYGRGMPRKPHKRPLLNKAFAERNKKPELWDKDRAQDHQRARKAKTDGIQKNLYGKGL